jgi:hypothetical protein
MRLHAATSKRGARSHLPTIYNKTKRSCPGFSKRLIHARSIDEVIITYEPSEYPPRIRVLSVRMCSLGAYEVGLARCRNRFSSASRSGDMCALRKKLNRCSVRTAHTADRRVLGGKGVTSLLSTERSHGVRKWSEPIWGNVPPNARGHHITGCSGRPIAAPENGTRSAYVLSRVILLAAQTVATLC